MPIYRVGGTVTVSCTTLVEASSIEEARSIAEARELASLCHAPFDDVETEAWHLDTDGEPTISDVTED